MSATSNPEDIPELRPEEVAARISIDLVRRARALPPKHDLYFLLEPDDQLVRIEQLRLSRARPEGIASAVARMEEASRGQRPRRAAASAALRADGTLLVLDGNSTVTVAAAAGWREVPCRIVDDKRR